eukprot:7142602-Prymnesium_polylepis.1
MTCDARTSGERAPLRWPRRGRRVLEHPGRRRLPADGAGAVGDAQRAAAAAERAAGLFELPRRLRPSTAPEATSPAAWGRAQQAVAEGGAVLRADKPAMQGVEHASESRRESRCGGVRWARDRDA